jgi:ABC-type uncharacterized transport system permease subunit
MQSFKMSLTFYSIAGAALYLLGGAAQALSLSGKQPERRTLVLSLGTLGVIFHTLAIYYVLHTPDGILLSFFPVASLVSWLIATVVLLSSLRKPLSNLFVGIFPVAATCVILAWLAPHTADPKPYAGGVILHILTSILAYSIFSIAAIQALLLACQEHQLKHHHTQGIVRTLPPLQLMERLLFEMIWVGIGLLTISLLTGAIFLEDIFSQHLVHKTILSIIAWIVYGTLLWGRHLRGWRGITAIRWSLGGFGFLMLAYFGTKFAVELIINAA